MLVNGKRQVAVSASSVSALVRGKLEIDADKYTGPRSEQYSQ